MRILLLSPYHGDSHRYWCEQLQAMFPQWQWTLLTLPPRYFSWRIRGNGLSWFSEQLPALQQSYDLVIATGLTDVVGLKALVPELSQTPWMLYFHENQFAYPENSRQQGRLEWCMQSLYAAMSCDTVAFNSRWNQASFLRGAREMLERFPDHVSWEAIDDRLLGRCRLLAVPLAPLEAAVQRQRAAVPSLVWNHRWEHDKGPERLLAFLRCCDQNRQPLRVHVLGRSFRKVPPALQAVADLLENSSVLEKGGFGFIEDRGLYRHVLGTADIVLSTALQEFQGLSVMEAVQAGCLPLVPKRLCYPEFFDDGFCYAVDASPQGEAAAAFAQLQRLLANRPAAPSTAGWERQHLTQAYCELIEATAACCQPAVHRV